MTSANDDMLESSSEESQSEDDEEGWLLTEDVEKDFYKTLSQIKSKDPTIYKKDVEFFKNIPSADKKEKKNKKSTPLTLKEYERKIVLEHGGKLSDEDDDPAESKPQRHQQTYVEEQESLKKSLKAALDSVSDDEADEWGGLFKKREKTKEEKKKEKESYKEWLKGQKESAGDTEVESVMKPLHDFWTDPNLNEDDKFLRDYVINKQFLESDENKDENTALIEQSTDDEDEDNHEEKQFPKYRFEEADQEFIKRYPRLMANSVRRQKDHRKLKREEVKERKTKEKEKKIAQVKLKKKEKKKEIEEKIEELKKITGNEQLAFENVLKDDFDLDEHDKTMKRLFDEEFYAQDDPNFHPDNNDEGGDNWKEEADIGEEANEENQYEEEIQYNLGNNEGSTSANNHYEPTHCEDPDFIMDCDYDPAANAKRKESRSRRRKDKHRRTTLSEAVARPKPQFDPTAHESFQRYVEEYYAVDCEDFIGDLPCRFKYRRTVPNDYGLTVEEILSADPSELERWCSIKRIQQLRPEHKERGDLKVFRRKAADEALKRKILPSLFKKEEEAANEPGKEKDKKRKKKRESNVSNANDNAQESVEDNKDLPEPVKDNTDRQEPVKEDTKVNESKKKKKKKGNADNQQPSKDDTYSPEPVKGNTEVNQTKKKKKKGKKQDALENAQTSESATENNEISKKRKREKVEDLDHSKKKKYAHSDHHPFKNKKSKKENNFENEFKNKKNKAGYKLGNFEIRPAENPVLPGMSDARLLAYGIKPKKFKNKLKYKKDPT